MGPLSRRRSRSRANCRSGLESGDASSRASSLASVNEQSCLDSRTAARDEQLFLKSTARHWARQRLAVSWPSCVRYSWASSRSFGSSRVTGYRGDNKGERCRCCGRARGWVWVWVSSFRCLLIDNLRWSSANDTVQLLAFVRLGMNRSRGYLTWLVPRLSRRRGTSCF